MGILIALATIFMTIRAYSAGRIVRIADFRSIALPTPSEWFGNGLLSLWLNIAAIFATGALMIHINRQFNLLRTTSPFFATYFILTTGCIPTVAGQFGASSLLAVIAMLCVAIMFSIYNVRASSRRVFLVFFLLGLGILTEYTFALYIPVFIIGLEQMRVLGVKRLIAAGLGVITPAWIVWGLGLAPLPEIPEFEFTPPSLLLSRPELYPMLAAVATAMLAGFFLGSFNLLKIIGFNAQARAFNGLITLLSIATGLFAIVNFTNITFYITLLNAGVAFQVAHFFRLNVMRRGYIAVAVLILIYLAIYTLTMLTPVTPISA